jgi:hypothetical protein
VIDDTLVESEERFLVMLQRDPTVPESISIGRNSTASVIIKDDDTPGERIEHN